MTTSKKLSLGTAAKIAAPAKPTEPARVLEDHTGTVGPAAKPLPISAVPGGHWAHVTAAELAEDEKFEKDMEAACQADEVAQRKVYTVLHDLQQIFDETEMAGFPQLLPKLKDLPTGSNLFIDEYETTRNKDGKETKATGSRYNDLAQALPWIKAWQDYKDYCVEARKDRTKAKEEHIGWSAYRWDADIRKYGRRVKNGTRMIKDAMRVYFQMLAINQLPQVGCGFMLTDKNTLIEVGEPMAVWSKTEKDELTQQPLSTSSSSSAFLAMSVPKALEKANGDPAKVTYTMLIASAGRVTGNKDNATTEPAIKSLDELEGTFAELCRFLDQEHNMTRLRAQIAGRDKKNNPLITDDYIVTIQRVFQALEAVVTFPDFAARVKPAMAAAAERELRARGITPQSAANTKAA